MHPDEHAVSREDVACHEREVLRSVEQRAEAVSRELPVLGRDACLGRLLHELLAVVTVPDEVPDRDDRKAMVGCEPLQLGPARHSLLVLRHDLAQQSRGVTACEAGEVNRRLGVAGPLQDTAGPVPQRQDVSWSGEVVRLGVRADECLDGGRPIAGGDAGRGAVAVVDGHRERGALGLGVLRDHEGQLELVEALGHERHADQP